MSTADPNDYITPGNDLPEDRPTDWRGRRDQLNETPARLSRVEFMTGKTTAILHREAYQ